jgi:hypothetical protein
METQPMIPYLVICVLNVHWYISFYNECMANPGISHSSQSKIVLRIGWLSPNSGLWLVNQQTVPSSDDNLIYPPIIPVV